jgi:ABC-type phosphate/phosphonate transport system ATPase subunit
MTRGTSQQKAIILNFHMLNILMEYVNKIVRITRSMDKFKMR